MFVSKFLQHHLAKSNSALSCIHSLWKCLQFRSQFDHNSWYLALKLAKVFAVCKMCESCDRSTGKSLELSLTTVVDLEGAQGMR